MQKIKKQKSEGHSNYEKENNGSDCGWCISFGRSSTKSI